MRRSSSFLVISVLLATALWVNRPFRAMTWTVMRLPLTVVESLVGSVLLLPRLPALVQENAQLRREAASHQLALAHARDELRRLTQAGHLLQAAPSGASLTVASIIGRTIVPTEHTIMLNRGSRDGIVPDTWLMSTEGVAGRILEVHPTTSAAVLLTDPNSRVACVVERSREYGLLIGTGGRFAELLYVDLDADVMVGDQILSAGLGGTLPKGLVLGTVAKVLRDEHAASLKVWVRPAVRLNRLDEVVCLRPASS